MYSNTKRITISDIEDFGLFPNPAQESVNISLQRFEGKNITIRMIDQFGKELKSIELNNVAEHTYRLPLEGINNGIYSLWIFTENRKPASKKFIVNKMY